jgi:glycosyltransferase involved in cell wall biosynthesis
MTLLDKTNTLVIVPAYNEQDSIVSVIEEIKATGFSFVVIDDGSTDQTRKRAISAGARTISLPFNAGVGGAMRCGMKFALANNVQAVIQCDADGQHSPPYFEHLIGVANEVGSEIVVGSRFNRNESGIAISSSKKIGIKILAKIVSTRKGCLITDPTSGFRLTRRVLIREVVRCQSSFYLADTIIPLRLTKILGFRVSEVSVEMTERVSGIPSTTYLKSIGYFVKVMFEALSLAGIYRRTLTRTPNDEI